jgi:hypothetical protein
MATISEKLNLKRSDSKNDKFIISNLFEIYHELGSYEFKVTLSEKHFKNSLDSGLNLNDSDYKQIKHTVERWGRKINVNFEINENVSDGLAFIDTNFIMKNGKKINERLYFWVIKP